MRRRGAAITRDIRTSATAVSSMSALRRRVDLTAAPMVALTTAMRAVSAVLTTAMADITMAAFTAEAPTVVIAPTRRLTAAATRWAAITTADRMAVTAPASTVPINGPRVTHERTFA